MTELIPGGNLVLPACVLTVRVPGPFDVSALITDDTRVRDDGDFVFYNQPRAPGVRLSADTLIVDPAALRPGAGRVTVVVSAAEPGMPLDRLPSPTLQVTDPRGRALARFTPGRIGQATVLLLAEFYRRGGEWKVRAIGQGYADGLAGIARDFGVDIVDDTTPPTSAPSPSALPSVPAPTMNGFADLINSARAAAGSPPISEHVRLTAVARDHATAMATAASFDVDRPDGTSVHQRVAAAGYPCLVLGKLVISGPRTPTELLEFCLSDNNFRRTVHAPGFTHAGLAHYGGGSGDIYWTLLLAAPLTPDRLARTQADVIELTNRERIRAGLPPLTPDPLLTRAAQAHSADMVARDFYAHTCPDGSRPWDRAAAAGCTRRTIGENIANGYHDPAEVVDGWMNSPGHRANILKPDFTHIGVGLVGGGRNGTYWTQLFGA
ncbi:MULTISPECIES: CAP domain-containing protein [unclassified Nocardia]|uniref:CAP domain-containing protein n=1 Tax=unclassified Nocardia TaxID=2637762 RepID=UPI0024A926BB|nr:MULTISPECIES: CAP domain-containing protein [unclassified Nocardia]